MTSKGSRDTEITEEMAFENLALLILFIAK